MCVGKSTHAYIIIGSSHIELVVSETVLQWIWAMGEDNVRRKLKAKEKAGIRACVEVNMHGER